LWIDGIALAGTNDMEGETFLKQLSRYFQIPRNWLDFASAAAWSFSQ